MINRAVITRCHKYNGSMFDAFEYFYRLWELDPDTKFVSLYNHINKDFLSIKYDVDLKCFDNFIYTDPYDLEFNKALLFDTHDFYNINQPKSLKLNKLYVVANSTIKFKENAEYFDEYFLNKNYINKIYYKIHRIFDHLDNVYVNCMDTYCKSYLKILKMYPNAIIKDPKNNFQHYSLTKNFIPDIYKYFNKFIYIKTGQTYDRHPRQFTECAYQGIECEYICEGSKFTKNDNSYYRFEDRYDFEKRSIYNDIVISKMLDP